MVRHAGSETGNTPPSAEVKNEWIDTPTPPIRLHGVDRDNFIFLIFQNETFGRCSTPPHQNLTKYFNLMTCKYTEKNVSFKQNDLEVVEDIDIDGRSKLNWNTLFCFYHLGKTGKTGNVRKI
jgi:hypothetical protein